MIEFINNIHVNSFFSEQFRACVRDDQVTSGGGRVDSSCADWRQLVFARSAGNIEISVNIRKHLQTYCCQELDQV